MHVTFAGVRGSVPTPDPVNARYGGNTSCVAVGREGEPPSLLLDAGTGLRNVTRLLAGEPFVGALALSHLHPDHVQGLPFFAAADKGRVEVFLPRQLSLEQTLGRAFGAPLFPLELSELRGDWSFTDIDAGPHRMAGWNVLAADLPHGGGRTLGYRVEHEGASLAYITDHCPTQLGPGADGLGVVHPAVLELAHGVDLLIHDAHLTAAELPALKHLGHAAVEYAVTLAEQAGARQLALFHHAPDRTDMRLDEIVSTLTSRVLTFAAAEQQTIQLPAFATLRTLRPQVCQAAVARYASGFP